MRRTGCTIGLAAGMLLSVGTVNADPGLRVKVNQRGDFVALGNTLGQDCRAAVPAPVVGLLGNCGSNTTVDSAPDAYWYSDDANGTALADISFPPQAARSTAMLVLPTGAVVTHAFLYWAGETTSTSPNITTAVIERPEVESLPLTADESWTTAHSSQYFFQSVRDVTDFVRTHEAGPYRVTGVNTRDFRGVTRDINFAAWSMIVFYRLETEPLRNLAIFDGLYTVNSATGSVSATLQGFVVPYAGFDAKLGVIAYEGDAGGTGDTLRFGRELPLDDTFRLSDGQNPVNNFFNSTRSYLGSPVSNVGDLPQLLDVQASMSGYDLDVIDVTSRLQSGDTTAYIAATTNNDVYFLGAFITSISTFKPEFSSSTKTVEDLNGDTVRPGDTLRYTIQIENSGNDTAIDVYMTDQLPPGVTYVPETIAITEGPNAGNKTDTLDSDQAEYDAVARTLHIRLGNGADDYDGGTLDVGETTTVQFDVVVDDGFVGVVANLAEITATGLLGAREEVAPTMGNGLDPGSPCVVVVDECDAFAPCTDPSKPVCFEDPDPNICVECLSNAHCGWATPVCNANLECEPCIHDGDCTDPAWPLCAPSGACVQCTTLDTTLCVGTTPVCDYGFGICDPCTSDDHCSDPTPACMRSGACGRCSERLFNMVGSLQNLHCSDVL